MPKAASATPAVSAAEVLGPVLRNQVQDLRSWEPGVRLDRAEAVHHYRVTARRLRSELDGFRSLLDPDECRDLARELGRGAAALSGARDAEVVRHRVQALLRDESGPLVDAALAQVDRLLSEASGRSHQDSVNHLDTQDYDAFTRRLERFADLPPWSTAADGPADDVFRPLLHHEWARFRQRGTDAVSGTAGPERNERLHAARKAAKRARYVAEALTPVFGRRAKRLGKSAQRVQVVLGEHQDCTITQVLLGHAGEQAFLDGENGFVLGRMQAREATTADELREEFVRLFLAADRKKLRRWLG
ncbi:MAG: CHAD domain-containing protein [Nocardioidaceae bacterium]